MNEDVFVVFLIAAIYLFLFIKQPQWFRKHIEPAKSKYVEKHRKYVAWIRDTIESSESIDDDELWLIVQQAAMTKFRVMAALLFLLSVSIFAGYPVKYSEILGSNPPYWHEVLVGLAGGAVFIVIMRLGGFVSLRLRIRQLVRHAKRKEASA